MMAIELTPHEKKMIQKYIFLPLVRTALEHDKKVIGITSAKFREGYITVIDRAIHRVTSDIRKNKDDLFEHHIRMTRISWLDYEVCARNRIFNVVYQKSVAGEWIRERIDDYLPFSHRLFY